MTLKPSNRSEITSFLAMDVLRKANEEEARGRPIIHMEVGQPAAPAPKAVLAEAKKWLVKGDIGYTEALGIRRLRDRISQHYKEKYSLDIETDRVVVTTGSSAGFNLAFLSAFDVGDKIGLPSPGYPAYRNMLKALGLEIIDIKTGPEDRWTLSPHALMRAHKEHQLKGVLVASPANPSGTMLGAEALRDVAVFCKDEAIHFISDEIYHGLVFDKQEQSALAHNQDAIIVNSFSKYYCMTGWRIGWLILPEKLVRPVERLAQNFFISPPALSQNAAMTAFDCTEELEIIKEGYRKNRDLLSKRLPEMGLSDFLPSDGAFYFYVNCSAFTDDTFSFAEKMLLETGVAATPGQDFDPFEGHRYMRFSFAGDHADMKEAMARLQPWLQNLR